MIRLLIVDDEPLTAEGLYEMLSEVPDLELDLYKATSAKEAISWLSRTKMDIVLSDIRMPEMDGLQLQQWIHARWPRCKVIFLTGVRDIQYAQQALRRGGVDYILKTEGDAAIVQSIRQASQAISEDQHNERVLIRAKEQLREMLPLLRREWFTALLEHEELPAGRLNVRLQELDTMLNPEEQILLVCGRVDSWHEDYSATDQTLLLYAVQNIAEEYMERTVMLPIMLSGTYFVWLMQPKVSELTWEETVHYVQGTLESIQQTCRKMLKLPVSFISHEQPQTWRNAAKTYNLLKQNLILGLGSGEEMLLIYQGEKSRAPVSEIPVSVLSRMENAIEMGLEQVFQELLLELFHRLPQRFSVYAQAYYAVAVLLLNHWNKTHRSGSLEETNEETMIGRLLDVNSHGTKEQAVQFLSEAGRDLFKNEKQDKDERTERIINKLNRYIDLHLNKDLSLAVLAETVYLNPSYLSNLYKTYTGRNISDYITEQRLVRAKTLLEQSQAKVQEIALAVGFVGPGHFTRFFRKHIGVTPQEFRSRLKLE